MNNDKSYMLTGDEAEKQQEKLLIDMITDKETNNQYVLFNQKDKEVKVAMQGKALNLILLISSSLVQIGPTLIDSSLTKEELEEIEKIDGNSPYGDLDKIMVMISWIVRESFVTCNVDERIADTFTNGFLNAYRKLAALLPVLNAIEKEQNEDNMFNDIMN